MWVADAASFNSAWRQLVLGWGTGITASFSDITALGGDDDAYDSGDDVSRFYALRLPATFHKDGPGRSLERFAYL